MTKLPEDTSSIIRKIFWRKITKGDFFNIERAANAGPQGGGGQLYIDIPLGGGVSLHDFGNFFLGAPLDNDENNWQPINLEVASVSAPVLRAPILLTPRRGQNRRYRIANQNRQATGGHRHPAWSSERGFPKAPDDISSLKDPRMPDISFLKVFIARTNRGRFWAGYTNSPAIPETWPQNTGLEVLFEPNTVGKADGLIEIEAGLRLNATQLGELFVPELPETEVDIEEMSLATEVVYKPKASTRTKKIPTKEGLETATPRPDTNKITSIQAPRASEAEDLIGNLLRKTYGDSCVKRIGHTNLEMVVLDDGLLPGADFVIFDCECKSIQRFAEVKSSTNSTPTSIRLTSSELQRAKRCADIGLPYDLWIVVFIEESVSVHTISRFERDSVGLTIDDLISFEVGIKN